MEMLSDVGSIPTAFTISNGKNGYHEIKRHGIHFSLDWNFSLSFDRITLVKVRRLCHEKYRNYCP